MTRSSADLHPGTRSRPLYRPLAPDAAGRLHLIVTDGRDLPDETASRFAAVLTATTVWKRPSFGELTARLDRETIGLRLYVLGSEDFLWDVRRVAEAVGLGEGEIALQAPCDAERPAPTRRVQCIHCKTVADRVTTPGLVCAGCSLELLVRDHFSRRLAAFQGVARHGATRGEAAS